MSMDMHAISLLLGLWGPPNMQWPYLVQEVRPNLLSWHMTEDMIPAEAQ